MIRPSSADRPSGKVCFVGAGPGAPDLITVRGQRYIREAARVIYAGSLVPPTLLDEAGRASGTSECIDSSSLTLDEVHALCLETVRTGGLVARVHTGDPGLYGTVREQIRLLDRDNVAWEIVPGVTAAFAAAAAAGVSLTVPEITQSVILTRQAGRTPVPEKERLRDLARHHSTIALYLSAQEPETVQAELAGLPQDTSVICAYRVGWPDQKLVRATVGTLAACMREHALTRQTVLLILPGEQEGHETTSRLYAPDFSHGFRS